MVVRLRSSSDNINDAKRTLLLREEGRDDGSSCSDAYHEYRSVDVEDSFAAAVHRVDPAHNAHVRDQVHKRDVSNGPELQDNWECRRISALQSL